MPRKNPERKPEKIKKPILPDGVVRDIMRDFISEATITIPDQAEQPPMVMRAPTSLPQQLEQMAQRVVFTAKKVEVDAHLRAAAELVDNEVPEDAEAVLNKKAVQTHDPSFIADFSVSAWKKLKQHTDRISAEVEEFSAENVETVEHEVNQECLHEALRTKGEKKLSLIEKIGALARKESVKPMCLMALADNDTATQVGVANGLLRYGKAEHLAAIMAGLREDAEVGMPALVDVLEQRIAAQAEAPEEDQSADFLEQLKINAEDLLIDSSLNPVEDDDEELQKLAIKGLGKSNKYTKASTALVELARQDNDLALEVLVAKAAGVEEDGKINKDASAKQYLADLLSDRDKPELAAKTFVYLEKNEITVEVLKITDTDTQQHYLAELPVEAVIILADKTALPEMTLRLEDIVHDHPDEDIQRRAARALTEHYSVATASESISFLMATLNNDKKAHDFVTSLDFSLTELVENPELKVEVFAKLIEAHNLKWSNTESVHKSFSAGKLLRQIERGHNGFAAEVAQLIQAAVSGDKEVVYLRQTIYLQPDLFANPQFQEELIKRTHTSVDQARAYLVNSMA